MKPHHNSPCVLSQDIEDCDDDDMTYSELDSTSDDCHQSLTMIPITTRQCFSSCSARHHGNTVHTGCNTTAAHAPRQTTTVTYDSPTVASQNTNVINMAYRHRSPDVIPSLSKNLMHVTVTALLLSSITPSFCHCTLKTHPGA